MLARNREVMHETGIWNGEGFLPDHFAVPVDYLQHCFTDVPLFGEEAEAPPFTGDRIDFWVCGQRLRQQFTVEIADRQCFQRLRVELVRVAVLAKREQASMMEERVRVGRVVPIGPDRCRIIGKRVAIFASRRRASLCRRNRSVFT